MPVSFELVYLVVIDYAFPYTPIYSYAAAISFV